MNTNEFFTKQMVCPVCKEKFETRIIKSSAVRTVKRDTDFCLYFEPINKLFYDVWVCPHCGYAAMYDRFESVADNDVKKIKDKIKKNWVPRDFSGEHTIETALEMYKLALLSLQVINAKSSDIVKVTIRIAWLYRFMKDPKETQYLEATLNLYMQVYQKEKFPVGNLDERTCMYMIGELNRRMGKNEEAGKWFYNVIALKEEAKAVKKTSENTENTESEEDKAKAAAEASKAKKDSANIKVIVNMAREQLQLIRQGE